MPSPLPIPPPPTHGAHFLKKKPDWNHCQCRRFPTNNALQVLCMGMWEGCNQVEVIGMLEGGENCPQRQSMQEARLIVRLLLIYFDTFCPNIHATGALRQKTLKKKKQRIDPNFSTLNHNNDGMTRRHSCHLWMCGELKTFTKQSNNTMVLSL